MRSIVAVETLCSCSGADHELRCILRWVVLERGRLFEGLYDAMPDRRCLRRTASPRLQRVKLLNPAYHGDADEDAAMRRFALLEID